MKKIIIISDKNKSSKLKEVIKNLSKSNLKNNNFNFIIGGDGFMLKILKE